MTLTVVRPVAPATAGPAPGDAWWTGAYLSRPPQEAGVRAVAEQVRRWWADEGHDGCEDVFAALGWPVLVAALAAEQGGVQAVLVPRPSGGFAATVDPRPAPWQDPGLDVGLLVRWRLAHEYAHTFFYARGSVPRRARAAGADEEAFCDAFANCLLDVDLTSDPGRRAA